MQNIASVCVPPEPIIDIVKWSLNAATPDTNVLPLPFPVVKFVFMYRLDLDDERLKQMT